MNLRWLWLDYFPPDLPLTRVERVKAKRLAAAHWKCEPKFRGARSRMMKIVIPATILAIVAGIAAAYMRVFPGYLAFWFIYYPTMAFATLRVRQPFIRQALNEIGHPICIGCGYLLHGSTSECCPECGEQRVAIHARALTPSERATPEVVGLMQRLGYAVCRHCGAMWFDEGERLPRCPSCSGKGKEFAAKTNAKVDMPEQSR